MYSKYPGFKVTFVFEDFEPALAKAGIDPSSITSYEWSKFTDDFVTGTHWDEVAEVAAECLLIRREDTSGF